MAKRWSLKEDIIICKYCIENHWAYVNYCNVEEMMSRLEKAGCAPRSFSAIRQRAYAYELLQECRPNVNATEQVLTVYETIASCNSDSNEYQRVKSYIRNVYNPSQRKNVSDVGPDNPFKAAVNTRNALGFQYTIDYQSTFPMVLQKYIKLKGIKKHTTVCKRIGMKPDTFSAILRGKYKDVKKDNILRICVGLELKVEEAEELLNSAGYMLSDAIMTDVVVKAFLWNRVYSAVAINLELYENNAQMLFDDCMILKTKF